MQKHIKKKFENLVAIGIVILLSATFIYINGSEIHAKAVYNEGMNSLSAKTGVGFFLVLAITGISLLFIFFASDFIISRNNAENKEKEIKDFIHQCLERRYSVEETFDILEKKGWKREELQRYLE